MRPNFLRLMLPLVVLISSGMLVIVLGTLWELDKAWIVGAITVVLSIMLGAFLSSAVAVMSRNPTTFTISLLGFPRSGKTVYLTVLFDELQRGRAQGVDCRPYGQESAEKVSENLNSLMRGNWLPPTEPGTVFYYRAIARIPAFPFRRTYKLEIGDFAGESMQELDPSSEKWLHKASYFRYVVQSDAVIFAIDSEVLLREDPIKQEEMQNAFVTALNVLIENKASIRETRLNVPLALVFMKSDLLKDGEALGNLLNKVSRLIDVCNTRCRDFKYFFVSSTGPLGLDGHLGSSLMPNGVTEPAVWLVRKGRSLFGGAAYHSESEETVRA